MNEKLMNQVAEMKKQTIGVEVEMNSIERSKAARLAAEFFGTRRYAAGRTPPAGTATAPGPPGTPRAASGNSRRTAASTGRTAKSARWLLRS